VKLSRFSKSIVTKLVPVALFIVTILMAGCSADIPVKTVQTTDLPVPSSAITPVLQETGTETGEITGVIEQVTNRWPDTKIFVFAASFEGDTIDQGYYYLESSNSPSGEVDSQGHFDLSNIPVGHYVLVVGPSAEESIRLVNLDQEYFLVDVIAANKLDLGTLLMAN
jgi:hypothetical protein